MTVRNENMPPCSYYGFPTYCITNIESMIVFSTYGLSTLILFVLNVYSTGNFWLAWTTEPGIIPRRKKLSSSIANTLNLSARAPYKQTLILQGRKREVYFCRSCNIYRPPRAQHCPVCNSCVERFWPPLSCWELHWSAQLSLLFASYSRRSHITLFQAALLLWTWYKSEAQLVQLQVSRRCPLLLLYWMFW